MFYSLDAIKVATRDDAFTVLDVVAQYSPSTQIWFGENEVIISVDNYVPLEETQNIARELEGQVYSEMFLSAADDKEGKIHNPITIRTKEYTINDVYFFVEKLVVPFDKNMYDILKEIGSPFHANHIYLHNDKVEISAYKRVSLEELSVIKEKIPGDIHAYIDVGDSIIGKADPTLTIYNNVSIPDDLREELGEIFP